MKDPNTNTTAGGYKYSRMRTVIMKAADTIVTNAFGSGHVLAICPIYYSPSSETASGLANTWAWFIDDDWSSYTRKSICDLPNETQIYGQQIWGRGSAYINVGYEVGIDKYQFSAFARHRALAQNRSAWWLRSVYSASYAAFASAYGYAYIAGTASAAGVRPRFLLVG